MEDNADGVCWVNTEQAIGVLKQVFSDACAHELEKTAEKVRGVLYIVNSTANVGLFHVLASFTIYKEMSIVHNQAHRFSLFL